MKKVILSCILSVIAITSQGATNCPPITPEVDYIPIQPSQTYNTEQKKPIKITEFFNYACSHCADMNDKFENWIKNNPNANKIQVERVALGFNPTFEITAKLYYALVEANEWNLNLHSKIFKELHEKGNIKMIKMIQLKKDTSELTKFLSDNGVKNTNKVIEYMNSFSIATKVSTALKISEQYKIEGTPSFSFNDKYLVGGKVINNYDDFITKFNKVSNYLSCAK